MGDTDRIVAIAKAFHETYERLAPEFGWETQEVYQVPWDKLPLVQRWLMIGVVDHLLNTRVIRLGIISG